ncbi:MAG: hypothetical protein ACQEVA_13475 [Myxococcota bacterium]
MSIATTFDTITNDEDASRLMPGGSAEPHLVIFCGQGADVLERAEALLETTPLPSRWRLARVDPKAAENTARWFGLGDTASMAVIREGAILAIEQECSREAFERLIEVATRREQLVESA